MENHNWTQPANQFTGSIQQIFQNPSAPFINSLVDGSAYAIDQRLPRSYQRTGRVRDELPQRPGHARRKQSSYPSVRAELHLGGSGHQFRRAQRQRSVSRQRPDQPEHGPAFDRLAPRQLEGRGGRIRKTSTSREMAPGSSPTSRSRQDQWTVPLTSFSGNFAAGFVNDFNLSTQFNYAAKHNPMVFFTDTNGGNDPTPANPLSSNYAPLQQLFTDLDNDNVAEYNWITPNQFNDMHTTLAGGYKGLTGDPAKIKQGDDFLAQIIPVIMASNAYKNHGAIIIWFDESEAGRRRRQSRRLQSHHRRDRHLFSRSRERRRPSLRQHRQLHAFLRSAHDAGNLPRRAASR